MSAPVISSNISFALSFIKSILFPFSGNVNKRTITLDFTNATTVNNTTLVNAGWQVVGEKIYSKKLVMKSGTFSTILPNTNVATKTGHTADGWENKATEAAINLSHTLKVDLVLQIVWEEN
jgi:hypothetical protein